MPKRVVKPSPSSVVSPSPSVAPSPKPAGIYQDVISTPLAWIQTLADVERFKPYRDPADYDFSVIPETCRTASPFVRMLGHGAFFDIVNGMGARGIGLKICSAASWRKIPCRWP